MDELGRALGEAAAQVLRARLGPDLAGAVVFGSYARGDRRPESDLDVLAVLERTALRPAERCDLAAPALADFRRTDAFRRAQAAGLEPELEPVVLTVEEVRRFPPLLLDVVADGAVVWDRGPVAAVLGELRERMARGGVRRVWMPDGSWYWDLKPGLRLGEVVEL